MRLPPLFVDNMKTLLGEEAADFFASYREPRTYGLRANEAKISPETLQGMLEESGTPIPWCRSGFYLKEEDRPGKHVYYHLGLYYIQEPSAMLPAELLGARPGHRVLDLCAAPGGKSTQLAAKLRGSGVLVANDNAPERTKALAKNIELAGVRNAVVLNEEPRRIADRFGAWFDRVLVDAPCSGEGMFRKDEGMAAEWERHPVDRYARMQQDILREAARLVAPGGRLVYSTCTFNPRENEGTVARFLAAHPSFKVVLPDASFRAAGIGPGRPDWLTDEERAGLSADRLASLAAALRVWPHRSRGEGHFAVLLERSAESPAERTDTAEGIAAGHPSGDRSGKDKPDRFGRKGADLTAAAVLDKFAAFREDMLPGWIPQAGTLAVRGNGLYMVPDGLPELKGLQVVRPGWMLGSATAHRFEPSQAFAMGLTGHESKRLLQLASAHPDALRYLKGETLQPPPDTLRGKGWTLVCIDGYPAGWGRWDGMSLKNERLPGWRWI